MSNPRPDRATGWMRNIAKQSVNYRFPILSIDNMPRGDLLIFDIDRVTRSRDHIYVHGLNFAHSRIVRAFRFTARDSDIDISNGGLELVRPRVVSDVRRREDLAFRATPSFARSSKRATTRPRQLSYWE